MADTVQELLEDMVPELEDLARKRIFSTVEIKEIVRKRRDFEYKLKRRESQKTDYLRYVTYERALDKLRDKRKKRLGYGKKSKSSVSDFSMQKRLHFIFDRMLRKWKGDVGLWMQYIDFCIQQRANKMLHSVLARALQYHPRDVSLWVRAATWHFDDQGDIKAARIMCQRGLRMIDDSVELWCHYLRLELCYIDKLRQRQRLLGIEGDMPEEEELAAALATKKRKRGDEDGEDESKDDAGRDSDDDGEDGDESTKGEKEKQPAASGARALAAATLRIASAITDNACKTMPASLPLLLGLATVCVEFPHTELLEDKLFTQIAQGFPSSREGWAAAAARAKVRTDSLRKHGRPVTLAEVDAACAAADAVFREAVAQPAYAKESALWEAYVAHARAKLAGAAARSEAAEDAERELRDVYTRMRDDSALADSCPEGLLSSFVADLTLLGETKEALRVAEEGCAQLAATGRPLARLVQLRFSLVVKAAIAADAHAPAAEVADTLSECVTQINAVAKHARIRDSAKDAARKQAEDAEMKALADGTSSETLGGALLLLWGEYLEYLLASDAAEQAIGEAVEEGVEVCKAHSVAAGAALRRRQLHWVCASAGIEEGRKLYRQLMRSGERATTGQLGLEFLRGCIALEMQACATEGKNLKDAVEPVRWLFEAASRLEGEARAMHHASVCVLANSLGSYCQTFALTTLCDVACRVARGANPLAGVDPGRGRLGRVGRGRQAVLPRYPCSRLTRHVCGHARGGAQRRSAGQRR